MTGIAGVDEVGRGCLAGPVYAAAVILKPRARLPGLNYSKKLSREQREELAPRIEMQAIGWAVASASVEEIDTLNILRASLLAMSRALAALTVPPLKVIVDGLYVPEMTLPCPAEAVVEGDGKYREIMAASILAKVARDAHMRVLDSEYPGYGFAQHKGYGTAEHQDALKRLGPSKAHRRWFAPVMAQQELFSGAAGLP